MSAVDDAAAVLGDRARRDVPLGPLTTYRVGGSAALLVEAATLDDLAAVSVAVARSGIDVLVVGNGSNLLVADAGFPGLAVVLGEGFEAIEISGTWVRAGGAVSLPVLARRTAAAGVTGLEWAVGVPGTVGGGVRMNAGGHGSDISRTLVRAGVFALRGDDAGRLVAKSIEALALGYRRSSLASTDVVVDAAFQLEADDPAQCERLVAGVVRWRRDHQPGGANAGSVFSNPPGDAAGRLIEEAGLKGHRRGSAFVSPKHANFFQVEPGGSADDVHALAIEVGRLVAERTGVTLALELRTIGFDDAWPSTGG